MSRRHRETPRDCGRRSFSEAAAAAADDDDDDAVACSRVLALAISTYLSLFRL
jgi:hypothetical protein